MIKQAIFTFDTLDADLNSAIPSIVTSRQNI